MGEPQWGADLEALLSGHVRNIMQTPSRIRHFVWKHSSRISLGVFLTFFGCAILVSFATASHLGKTQENAVSRYLSGQVSVEDKLDYILSFLSAGIWSRFFYAVIIFLIFALIAAFILSIWVDKNADTNKPSFIVLTRESEKQKEETLRKYEKRWVWFIVSVIVSITTSVVANIIFSVFWRR